MSIEAAAMLTLTDADDAIDAVAMASAGGFGWWYADLVDVDGNGVVVIAGEGLPFLPGIASSARAGRPVLPASRPSLNVAVYERGICTFYGLRELSGRGDLATSAPTSILQAACADHADATVVFGDSTLRSRYDDVEGRFVADLDLDVGVGRLTGTVTITGPRRRPTGTLHTLGTQPASIDDVVHRWAPQLGPARGEARLRISADGVDRDVVIVGSGYHDRNSARRPLHDLGIEWWTWARAEVFVEGRVHLRIVYACWPEHGPVEAFGVDVDDEGRSVVVAVDVELVQRRSWLGMRDVRRLQARTKAGALFLVGEAGARVDDGPFYLRSLFRADVAGAGAVANGFIEVVQPRAVDRSWQRPFVKMKVTPALLPSSSLWHSLFAGPRAGRIWRLLRRLMGRR